MKVLITGANGQLGTELKRILQNGKSEIGSLDTGMYDCVSYVGKDQLDISNKDAVFSYILSYKPDIIFNAAAYTNVDGCEENADIALKANALGVQNIALAAKIVDAELVHVSTDYVFSGKGNKVAPYLEWDKPDPQGVYGKSKLMGEQLALLANPKTYIVRTAWLYGYKGNNFVKTIINAAKKYRKLRIVNDQIGNPTSANDLAHHLLLLPGTGNYGLYHCTNEGICSWYDFAVEFLKIAEIKAEITPISSDEYPTPTKRPEFSALDNMMLKNTVGNSMRDWKSAIHNYIENLQKGDLI